MPPNAHQKGKRGELDAVHAITELCPHWTVSRRLMTGREDDRGDIAGVPDTTVQVKSWASVNDAITNGLPQLRRSQFVAGTKFGVLLVRRRGGRFVAVMDLPEWVAQIRSALGEA
jgi:hypothetical protein